MGIESRDYLRGDNTPRSYGGGGWGGSNVLKTLIIANVVVFVLQAIWTQPLEINVDGKRFVVPGEHMSVIQTWLDLNIDKTLGGFQVWRLVTYAFCHNIKSVWHIVFNMMVLYFAGRRIQSALGPREFLLFYLLAAVISGLGFVLLQLTLGKGGIAIGASGAVAAVFIIYAMKYPYQEWLVFFVLPVQVRWLCLIYIIYDLHPVLLELGGGTSRDGVAHAAHLGGYLFGFLYETKQLAAEFSFGSRQASQTLTAQTPLAPQGV